MVLFDFREPVNAWSHAAGMVLALPVTWLLWKRCTEPDCRRQSFGPISFHGIKALCLLVFGVSLVLCYGISALFHATPLTGRLLGQLHRLDHVGIYVLIAGTYTPIAWSLMRGPWRWRTLTTVWAFAFVCSTRVWWGGVMPIWVSTPTYLVMGWGALFCYFHLAATHSHRSLMPLPLGGVLYSVGAALNLAHWPVLCPGVFAAHELFHLFVIAGSACHVFFMLDVVIPAQEPPPSPQTMCGSRAPRLGISRRLGAIRPPHVFTRAWARDFD